MHPSTCEVAGDLDVTNFARRNVQLDSKILVQVNTFVNVTLLVTQHRVRVHRPHNFFPNS